MRSRFHDLTVGVTLLLLAGPAGAADQGAAARVTASVGTSVSGNEALELRGSLDEGADIETGEDGNCALLVDEDAVMELCGGTSVSLERKGGDPEGPRVVKLDRGEIRMVVEPRLGEERIEIHTPAAIATILGTILHVSVDALGITTITTAAAKVLVESSDPSVKGATTIEAGQQVVIEPGQAPPPAQRLDPKALSGLGGCLIDFHSVSLSADRASQVDQKVEQEIADVLAEIDGTDVAAAAGKTARSGLQADDFEEDAASPEGVLDQIDTGAADPAINQIVEDVLSGGDVGVGGFPGASPPPDLSGGDIDVGEILGTLQP